MNLKIDYNNYKNIVKAFIQYSYLWKTMTNVKNEFNSLDYQDLIEIKRYFQIKKWYLDNLLDYVSNNFWEEWKEFIEEQLEFINKKSTDIYSKILERKERKIINDALLLKNQVDKWEIIFEEVIWRLIKWKKKRQVNQSRLKLKKWTYENESTYVFSDVHFWKKWNELIVERMNYLLETILKDEAQYINIIFSWDLVETLAIDWMHPWQLWEMDIIWIELADFSIWYIKDFLEIISENKKYVRSFWCPWNHDRMTKEHFIFDTSWWKFSLFETIKAYFYHSKNVEVDVLKEVWNKREINWFNFIIHHWDDKTNRKDWRDVYNYYWDSNKHNIQISWHLHYSFTEQCWSNFTKHQVWMIAWDSTYWSNLLLKWDCSFTKIKKNKFNKPEITTIILWI